MGAQRHVDEAMPFVCAVPPGAPRAIDAALNTWSAALAGTTDYWARAVAGGRTPLELAGEGLRWWQAMSERRPPEWASPHEIVRSTPLSRVRDFSAPAPARVTPTLVLPPQAGHDSCIVDYSSEQSQMQTIRAVGLERLYAMDWVGATAATRHATISDYLGEIAAAVEQIGGPVNLVGDCQGGWLATIYAALHPDEVNTLTIAGAPIDFHAGDAVIHEAVESLSDDDLSFYRNLVALGGGVLKGELLLAGFIVIKPENELARQLQLLANMGDETHLRRYRAFEDWFKHTQDISGTFYLWLVEHLFRDNELIRGELTIDGARVDLRSIRCPVNLLAGAADHITPPAQVFALERAVSTPRRLVTTRTSSGGHLGLFMGTEALREHWPPVMAGVLEHSRRAVDGGAARRRGKGRTPRRRALPAP